MKKHEKTVGWKLGYAAGYFEGGLDATRELETQRETYEKIVAEQMDEIERLQGSVRPFTDAFAERVIKEQVRTIDRLTKRLHEARAENERLRVLLGMEPLPETLEEAA